LPRLVLSQHLGKGRQTYAAARDRLRRWDLHQAGGPHAIFVENENENENEPTGDDESPPPTTTQTTPRRRALATAARCYGGAPTRARDKRGAPPSAAGVGTSERWFPLSLLGFAWVLNPCVVAYEIFDVRAVVHDDAAPDNRTAAAAAAPALFPPPRWEAESPSPRGSEGRRRRRREPPPADGARGPLAEPIAPRDATVSAVSYTTVKGHLIAGEVGRSNRARALSGPRRPTEHRERFALHRCCSSLSWGACGARRSG
jgi:hypothetical protein